MSELARARTDVAALVAFRWQGLTPRQRRAAGVGLLVVAVITLEAALLPILFGGLVPDSVAPRLLDALPALYAGLLVTAIVVGIGAGGGRELVPTEQAVALPISAAVQHFGALLLAPINVAWLAQAWTLLVICAFLAGGIGVAGAVAWLVWATALAQVVAWLVEGLRRTRYGVLGVRLVGLALLAAVVAVAFSGDFGARLDRLLTNWLPMNWLVDTLLRGGAAACLLIGGLLVSAAFLVVVGVLPARWVAGRVANDEQRIEARRYPAAPLPGSDLAALIRADRESIWRSVPNRRGALLLVLFAGGLGVVLGMEWDQILLLPGIVATGTALMCGVNVWSLDGRGALWRAALPVSPRLVFAARALVLAELFAGTTALTLLLVLIRAGTPTLTQLVALPCVWVVITAQALALSLQWSGRAPYAVDLRSPRATPAPPATMLAYTLKMALGTTVIGVVFSTLAQTGTWFFPVLAVLPFLVLSLTRLGLARRRWLDDGYRSRVVQTVAAL